MNVNHGVFSFAYAVSAYCTGETRESGVDALYILMFFTCFPLILVPFLRIPFKRT